MSTSDGSEAPKTLYDFTVKDAKGNDVDLSVYKGKVLLIVNVPSKCGLTTSNYTELNLIYGMYNKRGLEILAFPCDQFGHQEPESQDKVLVCTSLKSVFPIFDKIEVNGLNTAPIYKFLKSGPWSYDIQWIFTKFLVDRDGQVAERYNPTLNSLELEFGIKQLLGILKALDWQQCWAVTKRNKALDTHLLIYFNA